MALYSLEISVTNFWFFFSNLIENDRNYGFPFDYEQNKISFGS